MNTVLVFSGLDPCGGAGVVADVETISQFGLTPLPIITNLTTQNTQSVAGLDEVDSALICKQFHHLQEDIDFSVVKIGLLSSNKQIKTIADLVKGKTVVLDPIISPSSGGNFLDEESLATLTKELLPLATIITPNMAELQALSGTEDEQKAVKKLACEWVLLTTADNSSVQVQHRLYHHTKLLKRFTYQKLPGEYHGSGCTLASAISALIAMGDTPQNACKYALDYTYQTLLNGKSVGKMQIHPNRRQSI